MTGRTLLFTGDGKGKTTAALGMALRAAGHNQHVLIVQFVKNDGATGELAACAHLPTVEIVQTGRGFIPPKQTPAFAEHCASAEAGLARAAAGLASECLDLLVLDEVCVAVAKGLLKEDAVLQLLNSRTRPVCIVLTGRGATQRLRDAADTVTEMRCLAHGLTQGIAAQPGVEY